MSDKIVNHFVLADGSVARYDYDGLLNAPDIAMKETYNLMSPDATIIKGLYLQDSGNLVANNKYNIIVIEKTVSVGDYIVVNTFDKLPTTGLTFKVGVSTAMPVAGGTATKLSDGVNGTHKTAFTPAVAGNYIIITYGSTTSTEGDLDAYDNTLKNESLVTVTNDSTKNLSDFPYVPHEVLAVDEVNLSEELKDKIDYINNVDSKVDGAIDEIDGLLMSEAGQQRYGVKWEMSNPDDLGQRCFSAVGLTATIGVGSTNGNSDFDDIYPWSDIKRCNIKANANGADIVTFEGETGFSLDGTNGDVFVRIPKFCYSHYVENGYEYITVSPYDGDVHPAFIENGKELDEIFIGAFEGCLTDNELTSVGGVIPSSNETLSTFLTSAQSKGDRYSLYDMRCMSAIWCLMAVEFGCRNTNQIVGYGFADFLQPVSGSFPAGVGAVVSATNSNIFTADIDKQTRVNYMPIGSNITICKGDQINIIKQAKLTNITSDSNYIYLTFDGSPVDIDTTCFIGSAGCTTNFCETAPSGALSYHTGRANWVNNSATRNPVRYRWIENIVGSLWHLFPDITFNNLQMYQCKNMKDYVAHSYTGGYVPVGGVLSENNDNGSKDDTTNVNYWIDTLTNDYFSREILFGKKYDKALTSTKAFGGYYYLNAGTVAIANGGGFDHLWRCNMLTNRAWIGQNEKWYLYGARLMYKHIN